MTNCLPFLLARDYFDSTYSRHTLWIEKSSLGSLILAEAYAFQVASLVAKERTNYHLELMRFAGIPGHIAVEQWGNVCSVARSQLTDFRNGMGRLPLSPLDFVLGHNRKYRIVTERFILDLARSTLNIEKSEAHFQIFTSALRGVGFGVLYPNLVNANLRFSDQGLHCVFDDEVGVLADSERAAAESETLRQVAYELDPSNGKYRALDLWSSLDMADFANAVVRVSPTRKIDEAKRFA